MSQPSKILLKLLSKSSSSTSGKISLPPLAPESPFPEPLEGELELGLDESESFEPRLLISSKLARPSSSLTAFLALSAVSSKLSAIPLDASSASPKLSATSSTAPAASLALLVRPPKIF